MSCTQCYSALYFSQSPTMAPAILTTGPKHAGFYLDVWVWPLGSPGASPQGLISPFLTARPSQMCLAAPIDGVCLKTLQVSDHDSVYSWCGLVVAAMECNTTIQTRHYSSGDTIAVVEYHLQTCTGQVHELIWPFTQNHCVMASCIACCMSRASQYTVAANDAPADCKIETHFRHSGHSNSLAVHTLQALLQTCPVPAGMLGYVVLLEHLQRLMYFYHVFTILQTVSIGLLMVQFWRKW